MAALNRAGRWIGGEFIEDTQRWLAGMLAWLAVVSVVVGVCAVKIYVDSSNAAHNAQRSCERSMLISPPLMDFYADNGAFATASRYGHSEAEVVHLARSLIPRDCS
jgi:hypothetical protein